MALNKKIEEDPSINNWLSPEHTDISPTSGADTNIGNSSFEAQTFTPKKVETSTGYNNDIYNPDIKEVKLPKIRTPGKRNNQGDLTNYEKQKIQLDNNLAKEREKNKKIRDKKIDEEYKTDILNKGKIEKNKNNYINYDEVDKNFNNVITDLSNIQKDSGKGLTEEDYKNVADKYGLDINDVKNPKNIYNNLKYSEEGKINTKFNKFEQNQLDKKTAFDRRKADIQTRLNYAKEDTNRKIANIEREIGNNITFATAQGAWIGGLKSSGYIQGIQNIKDGGDRLIANLERSLNRMETADTTNLERITEDYNNGVKRATEDVSNQMKNLKINAGLKLNGLAEKYGEGSEALSNALDEIGQDYFKMNTEAINSFTSALSNIQERIREETAEEERKASVVESELDKRYQEYATTPGMLDNINIETLQSEVENNQITEKRYTDLINQMISDITTELGQYGVVDQIDLQDINQLLADGKSPVQIVAQFRGETEKFSGVDRVGAKKIDKVVKIGGDNSKIYFTDGTSEIVGPDGVSIGEGGTTGININGINGINTSGATGDLRGLAKNYPGQAWAKNNNPAGITWNSNFDNPREGTTAQRLIDAGVQFSKGTARPSSEGGNYVTFPTIEDGLKAQQILMTGTYGNSTVGNMLKSWVGTSEGPSYAKQVAGNAGIDLFKKVSDLSEDELNALQSAKIQKESPGLYKLLEQGAQGKQGVQEDKYSNLSSLAQNVIKGGSLDLLTGSKKNSVIGELEKAGFFDEKRGDAEFYNLKAEDRGQLVDFINTIDTIKQIENLYDKEYVGSWDAKQERAKNALGIGNSDFAKLDTLTGKTLSNYIKEISGAAVSEQEVKRLTRNIPNVEQNEAQFKASLSDLKRNYNNILKSKIHGYGFKDEDTMKEVLGLNTSAEDKKALEEKQQIEYINEIDNRTNEIKGLIEPSTTGVGTTDNSFDSYYGSTNNQNTDTLFDNYYNNAGQ